MHTYFGCFIYKKIRENIIIYFEYRNGNSSERGRKREW